MAERKKLLDELERIGKRGKMPTANGATSYVRAASERDWQRAQEIAAMLREAESDG